MHPLIASTLAGIGLGVLFYGCVRLRMHLGPKIRDKFGNGARRAYWLVTIITMVILANIALRLLRSSLPQNNDHLMHEILFLVIAVSIAFGFIYRRINRHR